MKNIIFISPPAGGKGTQSQLLVSKYNYYHISVGDLLRKEATTDSKDGKIIKKELAKGNFVPGEIATKVLKKELENNKGPFVFDGYPRTLKQYDHLEKIIKELKMNNIIAVFLNLSEEEVLKRAAERMMCPLCNKIYNSSFEKLKPKNNNKCDNCNEPLITRYDDNGETYKKRYKNYLKVTKPLINKFKEKGILITINNPVDPDLTFNKIEKVIK